MSELNDTNANVGNERSAIGHEVHEQDGVHETDADRGEQRIASLGDVTEALVLISLVDGLLVLFLEFFLHVSKILGHANEANRLGCVLSFAALLDFCVGTAR